MSELKPHSQAVPAAVVFTNYSFAYAGSDRPVLHDVSFTLAPGSFTVLCGPTGSGKSTLLRALKPEVAVEGTAAGSLAILGDDPADLDPRRSAARTGFVMQDPENQLVTDTVWHELAFGLENLGVEREEMRRRVAETAHFFGIGGWFERKVKDLSGGQKQLLNLAAVVVMQPQVLVLDEPTSQLDPIAAKSFFDVLGRVNAELGITVVIIEHRLEDVLPMADRVLYLVDGGLAFNGTVSGFIAYLIGEQDPFAAALPAATRIAQLTGYTGADQPVTVREGRAFLAQVLAEVPALAPAENGSAPGPAAGEVALRASDLWFRYDRSSPFVLRGVDVEVRFGRIHALVGGNGSGKSTLLGALAGVRKPERGKVRKAGRAKVALLAQDPKSLFVCDTLFDDLMEWQEYGGYGEAQVKAVMERFGLERLGGRHPYDLSGGETQKAALAKVLLLKPDVLLMDEPVKGIDAVTKRDVAQILKELAASGTAILFTAHDLEFVSQVADVCSMMFGCEITCTEGCHAFFTDNLFYSTATSRIARRLLPGCVTTQDVGRALRERGAIPATAADAEAAGEGLR
ncbi:MAG: ATP-binding cassette domain-containing protein [Coriobacteriales bacterium]|nr:ATP-binding cassette domain-containing protein [Coriobacteriales bacterium]